MGNQEVYWFKVGCLGLCSRTFCIVTSFLYCWICAAYLAQSPLNFSGGPFPEMAAGRAMRPEQPDPQTAEPPGPRGPSEMVPEEVRQVWAPLPRRKRQRRRRRFLRGQAASCSRPVLAKTLSTIDARVRILEDALAELRHATAGLYPGAPYAIQHEAHSRGRRFAVVSCARKHQQRDGS